MNDTAIKNYCIWARNELIAGVEARMRLYGVAEGAEPAGAAAVGGRALSPEEIGWRDALLRAGAEEGLEHLRDRTAYTWFNRIAAVRYMEVHDFLPSRVRMFTRPAADGSWELGSQAADQALDVEIEGADPVRIAELKQAGEDGPLFRYLFLAQCAELSGCLPGVFQPVDACMALLLPVNLMDPDGVIDRMVEDIPEEDWWNVQVLGWMYQYYNSEVKDAFFASKAKETPDTIGPATQLFTPDWIVRYMVQNSLGRLWMLNNPGSPLRDEMEYYIEPDSEHEDFIKIGGPEDISLCDPACGSGHILVYAFELLAKMYLERGYREREIPELVLSKNLHGMEIDPRAAQIARLALAMCARGLHAASSAAACRPTSPCSPRWRWGRATCRRAAPWPRRRTSSTPWRTWTRWAPCSPRARPTSPRSARPSASPATAACSAAVRGRSSSAPFPPARPWPDATTAWWPTRPTWAAPASAPSCPGGSRRATPTSRATCARASSSVTFRSPRWAVLRP